MKCYICLHVTEHESPCYCKSGVHQACLMKYVHYCNAYKCSICRHELYLSLFHRAFFYAHNVCTACFIVLFFALFAPAEDLPRHVSSVFGVKCALFITQKHFLINPPRSRRTK